MIKGTESHMLNILEFDKLLSDNYIDANTKELLLFTKSSASFKRYDDKLQV